MISKNNQQGDVNSGVTSRFDQGKAISSLRNGTNVNQIRGINVANATGSGIPKHVTNVNTSLANATTGSTTTVTVTFRRDPTDKTFSGVAVLVKGYQGNPSPVQLASGSDSPINFILNNTGEALSLTVQATGNGGAAPLGTAPTVGLSLPKNSAGGTGTTTINSALTLKTNGVANGSQTTLNLAAGSNITITDNGSGTDTIAATIPNLDASKITTGLLALARGGTAVDLSASGSATAVLAQDASHVISARSLVAGDLPNHSAALITSGLLALARGGTNVDLSASGSATAVLAQDGSHVISARSLVAGDLPNHSAALITSGTLALARGGTNADLSATGGASQFLKQASSGAAITVAQPAVSDLTWDATIGTAGIGFFFGGYGPIHLPTAPSNAALQNVNKLNVMLMYLPFAVTVTKVVCFVNAVSVSASQFASFGLYNTSGTKVLDSGTFNVSSGQATGVRSNTITGVPLTAGFYYFCWTSNNSTDATFAIWAASNSPTSILNQNGSREGTGVATTAGALATPIGTITKTNIAVPAVLFEP